MTNGIIGDVGGGTVNPVVGGNTASVGETKPAPSLVARQENAQLAQTATAAAIGQPVERVDLSKLDLYHMTDDQLRKYFGSDAGNVRELLNSRSGLTLPDLMTTQKLGGLSTASRLLHARPDMSMDDILQRDASGQAKGINSTLQEPGRVDLLINRKDLSLNRVADMESSFAQAFENPTTGGMYAREATDRAVKLMQERTDIQPEDLSHMLGKMRSTVPGGTATAEGCSSLAEMFISSADLLQKRGDLNTNDVEKLVDVSATSPQQRGDTPGARADRFKQLSTELQDNSNLTVNELIKRRQQQGQQR